MKNQTLEARLAAAGLMGDPVGAHRLTSRRLLLGEAKRFWAKVDKRRRCWNWTGAASAAGYGRFRPTGSRVLVSAHRWAWESKNGPVPEGMNVCHHCDNPKCVRPAHLYAATQSQNMQDAVVRGRHHQTYAYRRGRNRPANRPATGPQGRS